MNGTIRPDYYTKGDIQFDVISFCNYHQLSFIEGNIIKYIVRAGKKDNKYIDLLKAKEYLDRLIEFSKNE